MNTTILLTVIVATIVALISWHLWISSTKGVLRDAVGVKRGLQDLLNRGFDGGILIITPQNSKGFVQFNKYVISNKEYGIEFSFPNANWSESRFNELMRVCELEGIKYGVSKGSNSMEFLEIDFGTDVNGAHEFVVHVFFKVFNLGPNAKYHVMLHDADVSPRDGAK